MELKWILEKQGVAMWIGFIWLRIGLVAITCEHGNGSIKDGEIFDWLRDCQFLKK
jgi:hypothetical protein